MYHRQRLSAKERIDIWLDLCDFSTGFMKENLSKKEFSHRLDSMRKETLTGHYNWLKNMAVLNDKG